MAHTDPDMTATYAALASHMEQFQTHIFVPGRDTKHYIKDLLDEGINVFSASKSRVVEADNDEDNDGDEGDVGDEGLQLDDDELLGDL